MSIYPVDVSVIIPTFNRPKLLCDAIESVLTQTRPAREIVIVDNGTDDNTAGMIGKFGNRVTYLRMEPLGLQAARNRGAAVALGTWLAMLDDDDVYDPAFLEHVAKAIADERANLVFTDHRKCEISSSGVVWCPYTNSENAPEGYWEGVPRPSDDESWSYVGSFPPERLLRFNGFYPSTMVIKKNLFDALGGYDPGVRGIKAEDIEFLTRALPAAKMALVHKPLVQYRIHGSNASAANWYAQIVGRWRIFEYAYQKARHGSAALAAALEADLPARRRLIFKIAFAHGQLDVMSEAAQRFAPADWTWTRRAAYRVANLFPDLAVAKLLSPTVRLGALAQRISRRGKSDRSE